MWILILHWPVLWEDQGWVIDGENSKKQAVSDPSYTQSDNNKWMGLGVLLVGCGDCSEVTHQKNYI